MTSSDPSRLHRLLKFLDQDPTNLTLRKDAIREARDCGDWALASQLCDAGLRTYPEELELLAASAFSLLQTRNYSAAETVLTSAVKMKPEIPQLRCHLAYALFMQKRHAEAYEHLSAASVVSELPEALVLRARCLQHLQRPLEAIADLRAFHGQRPDDADANGMLALLLYEQGQTTLAASHAARAMASQEHQLEALLTVASIRADADDYEQARDSFHALLKFHPECGRAWLGLALLKLKYQQIKAAKRDIKFAATYMPEHIGTWHTVAWIEIVLGDVSAAETAFLRALEIDRNFGETHGGLAVIAALRGEKEDAQRSAKRALRLDPESLSARYAELLLLQKAGQTDAARAVLEGILASRTRRGDLPYRDLVKQQLNRLARLRGTGTQAYH